MKTINLICEDINYPGGISIIVNALMEHLKTLNFNVVLNDFNNFNYDIVWTHYWKDEEYEYLKKAQKNGSEIWVELHDYRELCLTSRKSIGCDFISCDRPLNCGCFFIHAVKGCGRGRNPFKLIKNFFKKNRNIKFMKSVNKILLYSSRIKDLLKINEITDSQIIYHPPWHNQKESEVCYDKTKLLVWLGRFVPEKDPQMFVKLVSELKNVKGMMFGDGPELIKIQMEIKRLNLEDRIELCGWKKSQDIENVWNKVNHLIVTSKWDEPFGIIGLEAMAHGVPVVALSGGGIKDWCKTENGCVMVNSFDNLKETSNKLLSDLEYRNQLSNNGTIGFMKNYSVETQMKFLRELF